MCHTVQKLLNQGALLMLLAMAGHSGVTRAQEWTDLRTWDLLGLHCDAIAKGEIWYRRTSKFEKFPAQLTGLAGGCARLSVAGTENDADEIELKKEPSGRYVLSLVFHHPPVLRD